MRLRQLRKEKGWTLEKLSNKTHIAINTLSQYETNKREPSIETLKLFADTFNVSLDYLLNKSDQNIVGHNLNRNVVRVPVYGEIPAGTPIEMVDESFIEDYEDIDASLFSSGEKYFCLKVRGDSMLPKFESGDVLVIKQQSNCENGDYCAVSINHTECTFKKVLKRADGITLQPLNPAFEPMFFSNKDIAQLPITILGVVKEIRRSL